MKKYKLVGSAPSKERLNELINNYFFSDIKIVDLNEKLAVLYNSNGMINGYRVIEKKGRFRLELEVPK